MKYIFLHLKLLFYLIFFLDPKFTSIILNLKLYLKNDCITHNWSDPLWQGARRREMGTGLFPQLPWLKWKISEHHRKLPVETTNSTTPFLYKRIEEFWKWESFYWITVDGHLWNASSWWPQKKGPLTSINLWEILFYNVQPKLPLLFQLI